MMKLSDLSASDKAEAIKAVFKEHGGNLDAVIVGCYLELADRCAKLEQQIAELKGRKR